jgi:hypothetical protein
MERKIICFIDNTTMPEKGIYHCFGQNEDAKTNKFCETFLFKVEEDSLNPILTESNKFLFISPQEVKLTSTLENPPNEWKILLVHDKVSMETVIPMFTSDTLVLYHSDPTDAIHTLNSNRNLYKYALKSLHEPKGKYASLYKIAKIWKQNESNQWGFDKFEFDTVFNEIVKELINVPLECSLEFLHFLLEKKPKLESKEIQKLKEAGIDVLSWESQSFQSLKDKPTDDNESFEKFRNELLAKVITE